MTGSLTSLPGRLLMHSQLWLPWQVFASHVDKSRCVKLHGSSLLQTKMANHGFAKIWEMHGNANIFFWGFEINEHHTSTRSHPLLGRGYVLVLSRFLWVSYGLIGPWIVQLSRLGIRTMLESLLGWKPSIGKSPHQSTEPCRRSVCLIGCSLLRLSMDLFIHR